MEYIRKEHMICFTPKEIVDLFRITKQQEINTFCTEMGIAKTDLAVLLVF